MTNYKGNTYYISAHPELNNWVSNKLEQLGAIPVTVIQPEVKSILCVRPSAVRLDEKTRSRLQYISHKSAKYDIPYQPIEEFISENLDETFEPGWICNHTSCFDKSISCQVLMSDCVDYELGYATLTADVASLDMVSKFRFKRGIQYAILPTKITEQNKAWVSQILKLAGMYDLKLVREDSFHNYCKYKDTNINTNTNKGYHSNFYQGNYPRRNGGYNL
jgi:hypothetical protein